MELNIKCMKDILTYIIKKGEFDFSIGSMIGIELPTIVIELSKDNKYSEEEVAVSLLRCMREYLIISESYPRKPWGASKIDDVTLKGFQWLEEH